MDKTRDSTNRKIWPNSTCAISVRRKGQILLVVESLIAYMKPLMINATDKNDINHDNYQFYFQ